MHTRIYSLEIIHVFVKKFDAEVTFIVVLVQHVRIKKHDIQLKNSQI